MDVLDVFWVEKNTCSTVKVKGEYFITHKVKKKRILNFKKQFEVTSMETYFSEIINKITWWQDNFNVRIAESTHHNIITPW